MKRCVIKKQTLNVEIYYKRYLKKFPKILNTIFFHNFQIIFKKIFQKNSPKNIKIDSISIFVILMFLRRFLEKQNLLTF